MAAAEAAYVDHFVRTLPDGYDTVLDEDAANISAGQKQLLTIARAFLADPAILILDEATSNVDTRTEVLIQEAMARLRQGRTSFVIAHRLSTIRDADTIVVMDDGRIVEQGSHAELLAQARLLLRPLQQPVRRAGRRGRLTGEEEGVMTRRQRVVAISASAGAAAVALAIGLIVALTGSSAPPAGTAPPPSPARLLSPFTGEPVTALGPVLAVKIDNIKDARPSTGLPVRRHRVRAAGRGRASAG